MITEITDYKKENGLVFYDADCRMCVALARRFSRLLTSRGFTLLPLQTPWVQRRLGLAEAELLAEMRLLLPDGKTFSGADAFLEISRRFWWARPLYSIGRLPALMPLLRSAYGWLARHRRCSNGEAAPACESMPPELAPRIPFTDDQIRSGLPAPKPFGVRDLRCRRVRSHHRHGVFFEMP